MAVDPNTKLPTSEVIGLLSLFIFITFPPYILFREGPIFIFGDNPPLFLYIYSAIGGAICGVAFGHRMKIVGLFSGIIAALGGTSVFSYYALYPQARDVIHTSELLITLGIGAIPGAGIYFLVKKIIARPIKTRGA